MSTALRSVGFLDVLSSTPAESSRRAGWEAPEAHCIHARLRRLATNPREKSGLNHPPFFADRLFMRSGRHEDRELCAELVEVQWQPESEPARSEWAILEDISASGACLEIERPIPPDTLVSLRFREDGCEARVKYCKFDRINYLLGVQFEGGYRWSRRKFKPEHLIQFRLRRVPKKQ